MLGALAIVVAGLLAAALLITSAAARAFGFAHADEVAAVFCGSQKSLVAGIPIASVLFAGPTLGMVVLPIMIYHPLQLVVCAWLARRYADAGRDGLRADNCCRRCRRGWRSRPVSGLRPKSTPHSWHGHSREVTDAQQVSLLSRSGTSMRGTGGAGPAAIAGRARQSRHRTVLPRLPRAGPHHACRLQPPGLAERRSHDAERRCARAAGSGRRAHRLSGEELSGEAEARAVADRRRRPGRDQGVGGADAGFAAARSARLSGWLDLVHRPHGQRARPAGSAQRARSTNTIPTRRRPGRTASSPTRTATSGSPATSPATSASSIRRPASSPTIRCPTRARAIRTRRSSTGAACCGSPCRAPTWSAGSIRRPARSGW